MDGEREESIEIWTDRGTERGIEMHPNTYRYGQVDIKGDNLGIMFSPGDYLFII